MRIFGINILTDKKLSDKLTDAKAEQRKLTNQILAGLLDENLNMRRVLTIMKGSKHAGRC